MRLSAVYSCMWLRCVITALALPILIPIGVYKFLRGFVQGFRVSWRRRQLAQELIASADHRRALERLAQEAAERRRQRTVH